MAVLRMSSSASRYRPTPNRKVQLRERILMLAQRYRCYGVGVIYLKLRQAGLLVNYKRVDGCAGQQNCRCRAGSRRRCQQEIGNNCCSRLR
ncbi:hypothetical protein EA655_14060 [Pseudoxanthomonas winnipegensis]|uniref:HTH-like domain-containing protein n=1 Tax=Pseudoxanthomonas winnipegensis TaxID=2480810 RepID=A0A4Q8M4H6_9GAMM|nr:hypothetical protein EA655_14060 [Pseudoxanthomonas winnipegensis]